VQACKPGSVTRRGGTLIIYLGQQSPVGSINLPIPH